MSKIYFQYVTIYRFYQNYIETYGTTLEIIYLGHLDNSNRLFDGRPCPGEPDSAKNNRTENR